MDSNKSASNSSEQSEFVVLVLVDAVWQFSKQISSSSELKVSNINIRGVYGDNFQQGNTR